MRPPEACVLQVNDALWCHPKEAQNHSYRPFPAGGMISIRAAESLAIFKKKKENKSDVLSSMVTHTRNWCSAFNPSKCTHTAVSSEHTQQWVVNTCTRSSGQPLLQQPGSNWGFGALLKDTPVMVLRVERALVNHSPHQQSLPDRRFKPTTFGLQVQLSNH